jgi:hypothetical protein
MRWALLAAIAFSLSGSQPSRRAPGPPAPARAPVAVVVELFTSEGCSSCPPADALLSKLAKDQPVAGVQIIPLGMHVTYWDQLGWKDPASLQLATERQQAYGAIWGGDRVYTPQAVIDGREELVGSDENGVRRAIAKAAAHARARIDLRTSLDGNTLTANATIADVPIEAKEPLEAWMVVTEDGLTTIVKRGENGGRTLQHDAVVRAVFDSGRDRTVPGMLGFHAEIRPEWRRDRLKVVVVLQGKRTHRIFGAATTPLT